MPANATSIGPQTQTDTYSSLLDIRHLAACQDGTADTAIEACNRIEELLRILKG